MSKRPGSEGVSANAAQCEVTIAYLFRHIAWESAPENHLR